MTRMSAWLARLCLVIATVLLSLSVFEITLRLQDRLWPVVKLSGIDRADMASGGVAVSDITHHRLATGQDEVLTATAPERCEPSDRRVSVLFLGDSWIFEGGIVEGFQGRVRPPAGVCLVLLNAGVPSFSPSPMLVHGLRLIARHHPALVIANIDETDLMDETVRYKDHLVADATGRLERITADPLDAAIESMEQVNLRAIASHRLYLVRVVDKIYFLRWFLPRLRATLANVSPLEVILAPQLSDDPWTTHKDEIAHFTACLDEFLSRIGEALESPTRLIITHHPHLRAIEEPDRKPELNDVMSRILETATRKSGVGFYNADGDVVRLHGRDYGRVYTDAWSHLTTAGYARYGAAIAEFAQNRVDSLR